MEAARREIEKAMGRVGRLADDVTKVGVVLQALERRVRSLEDGGEGAGPMGQPARGVPPAGHFPPDTVAPAPAPAPAPAQPPASPSGRTLTVSSTGYSLPGHTATGIPVGWGVVAVDPSVIRLGSRMTIPGYGEGVAADTGSAVRGATIDLWFPTLGQARAWGRRTITISIH
jgi:3D (Asp-Asp-Asp) domain-containing protein